MKYLNIFSNTSILVNYCFSDVCILSNTNGNATSLRKGFLFCFILPHNSLHPLAESPLSLRLQIYRTGVQPQNG
ncbi:Os09g0298266 [Oryza sativa Japonica Group]|uniref:Os09g0298266 protein n=1 Tax=Oryza sativa subsp. japonica TaxID=39947 RepID=A0A0P0XJR8_ORYSJ|nr:hypothetical protein EE612_046724 [Oryza sativa]BAT07327.1 Os09g0298266 [Oryza sativa Japonica Group]